MAVRHAMGTEFDLWEDNRRQMVRIDADQSAMTRSGRLFLLLVLCAAALTWAIPFAWMAAASLRPGSAGSPDLASLLPVGPFGVANFVEAWDSGNFPLWYLNTILLCGGILAVQCVTISLAGYAFARLRFRYRDTLFHMFLLQLMLVPPILIVPNMTTLVSLHLYDTLPGVMAPYFASAFGVFLMRQTFRTRFLVVPARQHEVAVSDGVPAPQRGERGADRRREPDPAEGQLAGSPGRRLGIDQVADQSGGGWKLESIHGLLRPAHRCLRPSRNEDFHGRAS
jgi:hypothetical protein